MVKLHQIIAVEKGIKSSTQQTITDAYHQFQKPALFSGITRTYRPRDEEGEQFPAESTRVQLRAAQLIREVAAALTQLFDSVAEKDAANTHAHADVIVDGVTLLKAVPATTLLFLEKQLVDMHTFVKKLPTLDAAEQWVFSSEADCWATEPTQTVRTKKVPRSFVKSPATKEHPAQVEMYYEDQTIGYWHTTKFSGALPQSQVNTLLSRVERLQQAVKMAREAANEQETTPVRIGEQLLGWLFHGE